MGFPLAVISLSRSSHVRKAKEAFLCVCSIYSQSIDKQLVSYKTYQAIKYMGNSLEYNSSRVPYLKFQNGGSGTCQLRRGFSMKTPIIYTPFK